MRRMIEPRIDATADAAVEAAVRDKLGRNDPCWCGSGRKYKKCHGLEVS